MENMEDVVEAPVSVKQGVGSREKRKGKEILGEPSTGVVQTPKQVDPNVMIVEKMSELKYAGNFNNCAQTAAQAFIRCKVKSEAKAASLDMKWREESARDAVIQRRIAERRHYFENMKAHDDLQKAQMQMITEEFQGSSKLLDAHNEELEKAHRSLNDANATKLFLDKKMQKILDKVVIAKIENDELFEKLVKQVAEERKIIRENRRKQQEALEEQQRILVDTQRRHQEAKKRANKLKDDVESKKGKLKQIRAKQSHCDTKTTELVKLKKKLIKNRASLKENYNSLLKETKTDALNETVKAYQETEVKHQEALKALEESKSKNAALSENIKIGIDKLKYEQLDRQMLYAKYSEEIDKMQKEAEELQNQISKNQANTVNTLKEIEHQRKIMVEDEDEYASKKIVLDKLMAKREVQQALLNFAENELKVYTERVEKVTAEKEELQKIVENLSEVYKNSTERAELFDEAKRELESEKGISNKITKEKSAFYADSKKAALSDLANFLHEQESTVQKEELILHEAQFKLEKQESVVNSLNEQAAIKKERADILYNAFISIEKEIKERIATNSPSTSRVTNVVSDKQPVQKGILKSPEGQKANPIKKVTFDPILNDGLESEESVERMFDEVFGNQTVKEGKIPTSEQLFDSLLRNSPPEKEV